MAVKSERWRKEQKTQSLVQATKYAKFIVLHGCKKFLVFAKVYFRREEKTRVWFSPQQTPPSAITIR